MRRLYVLWLPALIFAAQPVAALDPQAVLYYKVPFGGQSKKANTSTFGFQLNSRRNTDIVRERPLLGMELRDNAIDNIRFRNIYLLGKRQQKARHEGVESSPSNNFDLPGLGTSTGRQSTTVR